MKITTWLALSLSLTAFSASAQTLAAMTALMIFVPECSWPQTSSRKRRQVARFFLPPMASGRNFRKPSRKSSLAAASQLLQKEMIAACYDYGFLLRANRNLAGRWGATNFYARTQAYQK